MSLTCGDNGLEQEWVEARFQGATMDEGKFQQHRARVVGNSDRAPDQFETATEVPVAHLLCGPRTRTRASSTRTIAPAKLPIGKPNIAPTKRSALCGARQLGGALNTTKPECVPAGNRLSSAKSRSCESSTRPSVCARANTSSSGAPRKPASRPSSASYPFSRKIAVTARGRDSSTRKRIADSARPSSDPFLFGKLGGVSEGGSDLLGGKVVLATNFIGRRPRRKFLQDRGNRYTGSPDDGFTKGDTRVDFHSWNDFARHFRSISRRRRGPSFADRRDQASDIDILFVTRRRSADCPRGLVQEDVSVNWTRFNPFPHPSYFNNLKLPLCYSTVMALVAAPLKADRLRRMGLSSHLSASSATYWLTPALSDGA